MILRELAARYDLKFNDKGFKKADKSIAGATNKLKELGQLLVGGVVAKGFVSFIDKIRATGDEIDKTSISLGVNRTALQEWRFAASLAGVQTAELNTAMRTLQKNALEAADGTATYKDEFDRLGITVRDSAGELKSADVLLTEMADGLQTLGTESEKVAVASLLMGRSGARLLPLFKDGAAGINAMREEAQELGGVLGDDLVDAAVELTDDMTRYNFVMLGIKATIGRFVIPIFTTVVKWATRMSKAFRDGTKDTKFLQNALKFLGIIGIAVAGKLLIAFAAPLLILLKWGIILAALFLIFDELVTLFEGGETAVGKFIDKVFGLGAAQEFIENHREGVKILGETWEALVDIISNAVTATINSISEFFSNWSAGFEVITESVTTLIGWIQALQKVVEVFGIFRIVKGAITGDLGPAIKNAKALVDITKQQGRANREAAAPVDRSAELRRRQTQRATGRGLGQGVERGPRFGETLRRRRARQAPETPGPTGQPRVPRTARRGPSVPRPPTAAPQVPRMAEPTVRAGATQAPVTMRQEANISVSVTAPPGTSTRGVADEVARRVKDVMKKENRAAMEAVKQRVSG